MNTPSIREQARTSSPGNRSPSPSDIAPKPDILKKSFQMKRNFNKDFFFNGTVLDYNWSLSGKGEWYVPVGRICFFVTPLAGLLYFFILLTAVLGSASGNLQDDDCEPLTSDRNSNVSLFVVVSNLRGLRSQMKKCKRSLQWALLA